MPQTRRSVDRSARTGGSDRRRDILRALAIVVAIVALLLTSSAVAWVERAAAADGDAPKRAVVVAGPVHAATDRYRSYAKAIADEAEAQGMDVKRIFHPYAPKSRVKRLANGADLFVYVGHGNGWPSAYGPFQEDTKNGLGLDPEDPAKRGPNTVVYKGANWLRENIRFAPNAVVILSHLSYASGNASSGMPIPTREVAIQRVDNFANGFLGCGAQVVWALGWQPGADIVRALHEEDATMDAVFMTRYRDSVSPLNGWIGQTPGYYPSERIPGATVHIDPHDQHGYLRGLTGNLEFTTTQWRNNEELPPDTVAPVLSNVRATQSAATLATGDSAEPVFTPNGDGISDVIDIDHTLSEPAFVEMRVKRNGNLVRQQTRWSLKGTSRVSWDGKRDDGAYVAEGTFKIIFTPTDRAGNQGEPQELQVRVLNAMKNPTVNPALFWPFDGDDISTSSALKARLTQPATASWIIRDARGAVVRNGIDDVDYDAGDVRFVWDGLDDEGQPVAEGKYVARIKVTRPQGTYAHDLLVRIMPYKLTAPRWTVRRRQSMVLTFESAEPLKGRPVVSANPTGVRKYELRASKVNPTTVKARLYVRRGARPGPLKIKIVGRDQNGQRHADLFTLRVK